MSHGNQIACRFSRIISYNSPLCASTYFTCISIESDLGGESGQYGRGASITGAAETIESLSQHSPSGFINADQVTSWLSIAMVLSFILVQNRQ